MDKRNGKIVINKMKILFSFISAAVSAGVLLFFVYKIMPHMHTQREILYFLIIYGLMFFSLLYFYYKILLEKQLKYENTYVFVILVWGAVFSLIFPPFSGHDENKHFATVYYYSSMIINEIKGETTDLEQLPIDQWVDYGVREDGGAVNIYDPLPVWYYVISNGNWIGIEEGATRNVSIGFFVLQWYKEIPGTIGCLVARLLHLGKWGFIFLVRYFNTMFAALMGYIAIKMSPVCKKELALLSFLPCFPWLFSTCNYDAVFVSVAILFMSFLFQVAYGNYKRSRGGRIVGMLICYLLLAMHKAYLVVFGLLILVLCFRAIKDKWKNKSHDKTATNFGWRKVVLFITVILLCCIAVYVLKNVILIVHYFLFLQNDNPMLDHNRYTILMILENPPHIVKLWFNTFRERSEYMFGGFGGSRLAPTVIAPIWLQCAIVFMLVIDLMLGKEARFSRHKRIGAWITALFFLFTVFLGSTLRDTPRDYEYMTQIYNRYLIPMAVILIPFYGKKQQNEKAVIILFYIHNVLLMILGCWYTFFLLNRPWGG